MCSLILGYHCFQVLKLPQLIQPTQQFLSFSKHPYPASLINHFNQYTNPACVSTDHAFFPRKKEHLGMSRNRNQTPLHNLYNQGHVKPKLENRLNQGNSRGQRAGSISEDQCVATLLIPRLQGPHPIHTTDSAPGHSSTHLPVSQPSPCICIICSRPKSQIGVMGLAESRSIACPAGLGIQGQNFSTFWILQWKVGHYIPRR